MWGVRCPPESLDALLVSGSTSLSLSFSPRGFSDEVDILGPAVPRARFSGGGLYSSSCRWSEPAFCMWQVPGSGPAGGVRKQGLC